MLGHKVKRLQQALAKQQLQLFNLEAENRRVRTKLLLLGSVCDALAFLRQRHAEHSSDDDLISTAEQVLLAQLDEDKSTSSSRSSSSDLMLPVEDLLKDLQQVDSISPPADPLHLFLSTQKLPDFSRAQTMSSDDVADYYRAFIRELSVQLSVHTAGIETPTDSTEDPVGCIKELFYEYFRLMQTLIGLQRGHEMYKLMLRHYEDPSQTLDRADMGHHVQVVQMLGLARQQQEAIADGFLVFKGVLDPITEERRLLQQQLECPVLPQATQGQEHQYAAAAAALTDYRQQLHTYEHQVQRLRALTRLDYLMQSCCLAYSFGKLSWVQLAQLHVLFYPYRPNHSAFAEAVMLCTKQQHQEKKKAQKTKSSNSKA